MYSQAFPVINTGDYTYHLTGFGDCKACGAKHLHFGTEDACRRHALTCKAASIYAQSRIATRHVDGVEVGSLQEYTEYYCSLCNNFESERREDVMTHLRENCVASRIDQGNEAAADAFQNAAHFMGCPPAAIGLADQLAHLDSAGSSEVRQPDQPSLARKASHSESFGDGDGDDDNMSQMSWNIGPFANEIILNDAVAQTPQATNQRCTFLKLSGTTLALDDCPCGGSGDDTGGRSIPLADIVLSKQWQDRYFAAQDRLRETPLKPPSDIGDDNGGAASGADPGSDNKLCVAVVSARSGAGKGCVVNHVCGRRDAAHAGDRGNREMRVVEVSEDCPFFLVDTPGLSGSHNHGVECSAAANGARQGKGWRFLWWKESKQPQGSAAAGKNGKQQPLAIADVKTFLSEYKVLGPDVHAVMHVVDTRFDPMDFEIYKACVEAGKLVFFVFTKSAFLRHFEEIHDPEVIHTRKAEKWRAVMLANADMFCTGIDWTVLCTAPCFFVDVPLEGPEKYKDIDEAAIKRQRQQLDFPALLEFLHRQLPGEVRLRAHARAAVNKALEPEVKLNWKSWTMEAAKYTGANTVSAAGGLFAGIAGPAAYISWSVVRVTVKMLASAGMITDAKAVQQPGPAGTSDPDSRARADKAWNQLKGTLAWRSLSAAGAPELFHIVRASLLMALGSAALSMADDVAIVIVSLAYTSMLPLIGSLFYAVTLGNMRRRLGAAVEEKAWVWHCKWIQQHLSARVWPNAIYGVRVP